MFPDFPELLFSPTEPTGGAAAVAAPAASSTPEPTPSTPAATSTGGASPAASTPAASSTPSASQTVAASAGTSTPAAAATPATPSWLDQFRQAGLQTTETNEERVRAQLLQSYQDAERLKPLAPHLAAYQQHAKEFHEYLANRQKPAATAQQDWTAQLGWNPPGDFNALRRQVQVDAQGNIVAVPGAAPDAVVKFQAAQAWRQEQTEKFLENPYKFMEPAIKHIAGQLAQEQAQSGVGQYKEQQQAQSFIQEHSNWLFDQDNGRPKTSKVFNPQTGRYDEQQVLSRYGQQFVQHLQDAAQQGLNPDAQQRYALQAVQNAYMASPEYIDYVIKQRQAATPAAPAAPAAPAQTALQQSNARFAATANPPQPPAGAGGNATPAPQKVTRENMEQIMLARIVAAGGTA